MLCYSWDLEEKYDLLMLVISLSDQFIANARHISHTTVSSSFIAILSSFTFPSLIISIFSFSSEMLDVKPTLT